MFRCSSRRDLLFPEGEGVPGCGVRQGNHFEGQRRPERTPALLGVAFRGTVLHHGSHQEKPNYEGTVKPR